MEQVATILLLCLPISGTNSLLPSKSDSGSLNGKHLKIVAEDWPPWFLIQVIMIAFVCALKFRYWINDIDYP